MLYSNVLTIGLLDRKHRKQVAPWKTETSYSFLKYVELHSSHSSWSSTCEGGCWLVHRLLCCGVLQTTASKILGYSESASGLFNILSIYSRFSGHYLKCRPLEKPATLMLVWMIGWAHRQPPFRTS